jgi:hypothetical protein
MGLFMFRVSRVFAGSFAGLQLRNERMVTGLGEFPGPPGLPTDSSRCSLSHRRDFAAVEGDFT